jgi:hypothetical protein
MAGYGLELSSYEEVKARGSEIYARLADGSMPCDDPWPPDRLSLFTLYGIAPGRIGSVRRRPVFR